MTLSTHVLDTGTETTQAYRCDSSWSTTGGWVEIAAGITDGDGRLREWVPEDRWHAGTYRLVFDTAARSTFFPEVTVMFFVAEPSRHHHVPLLLSPYGYTTYRGS